MTEDTASPRAIPREAALDSSLAFLHDPYRFIGTRCREHRSDVFEARLLMRPTLCLTGPEAAELFYDQDRFARRGAAPEPLRATLFGEGGVQGLDGAAHHQRKALFVALTAPDAVAALAQRVRAGWQRAAEGWPAGEPLTLYTAAQTVFMQAVCEWAGMPLPPAELAHRTPQMVLLFDGAASAGVDHWRARRARRAAERWAARLVHAAREGLLHVPPERALARIAAFDGPDGRPLPLQTAAVELLNVLRPTVAVAVWAVLAAHALHTQPGQRARLRQSLEGGEGAAASALDGFVHEVRRYYPFFPAVAARTRRDFQCKGYAFPAGRRVLLDLYGTHHDPRCWTTPGAFRPERFAVPSEVPAFGWLPQGGGDVERHHRCPGEGIAEALTKQTLLFLLQDLRYALPPQDLAIEMSRLPALPRSRFVLRPHVDGDDA